LAEGLAKVRGLVEGNIQWPNRKLLPQCYTIAQYVRNGDNDAYRVSTDVQNKTVLTLTGAAVVKPALLEMLEEESWGRGDRRGWSRVFEGH